MKLIRTYSKLLTIPTFEGRLEYLRLNGTVGLDTFGYDRIFNQQFYRSKEWKQFRDHIIARDMGRDLAMKDEAYAIHSKIFVHHMNPISINDLKESSDFLLNPEYMITVSYETHNIIHYGKKLPNSVNIYTLKERSPNDQCPWKKV